jgi:hypothetical protein
LKKEGIKTLKIEKNASGKPCLSRQKKLLFRLLRTFRKHIKNSSFFDVGALWFQKINSVRQGFKLLPRSK